MIRAVRSYRQYCALARSLDRVGERWTLLIIRELFARESRYADLREALPGIATNLLADRLRQLQADDIIEAYDAPSPVRATVYRLTTRGRELGPVLRALVVWGAPLVADGQGDDAFRTHWMTLGLPAYFDDVDVADLAPLTVLVNTGDEPATLHVTSTAVVMNPGSTSDHTDITLDGDPEDVFAFLTGTTTDSTDAITLHGPDEAVQRLRTLASRSHLAARSRGVG